MGRMGKKHEYPPGNVLFNVTDYAWCRFIFSKTQISFNHKKPCMYAFLWSPDFGGLAAPLFGNFSKKDSIEMFPISRDT